MVLPKRKNKRVTTKGKRSLTRKVFSKTKPTSLTTINGQIGLMRALFKSKGIILTERTKNSNKEWEKVRKSFKANVQRELFESIRTKKRETIEAIMKNDVKKIVKLCGSKQKAIELLNTIFSKGGRIQNTTRGTYRLREATLSPTEKFILKNVKDGFGHALMNYNSAVETTLEFLKM